MYGWDHVWLPTWIWPDSTIGRSCGALIDQEGFTPLTKKVIRVPLSRQNAAKAATTSVLTPSSTVNANRFPSPGRRVSTPFGGGTRPVGPLGGGTASAVAGRGTAARPPHAAGLLYVRPS